MVLKSNSLKNLIKKFKENEILSKGSYAFIFKIIGSLLGYVFLLLVTRNLGAEVWGVFALCMALLNITSILSRFGVDIALLRFVAQLKGKMEEVKGIYFQGISLVLFLSFLFSGLLFFSSHIVAELIFHKPHLTPYFKVIAFVLIPFTIIHVNVQTYRGLKRIKAFAFFQHTAKFLFSVIIFVLLFYLTNIDPITIVIYSFLFAVFIVMIISSYGLLKSFRGIQLIKIFSRRDILKTSYPMMLSSSILLLMAWADSIMLGIFETEAEIGIYNVAVKLAMITGIVLAAANSIVAPKISETYNNGRKEEFAIIVKESTRVIFFSSIPILILLIAFPNLILSFFGSEFLSAKMALYILLIGQIINAFSGSVGVIMQMTGREKLFQNILIIALFLNIGLNFLLIPRNNPFADFGIYAINGAAIASSVSIIFWNLTSVLYIYKQHQVLTFFNFK